MTMTIRNPGIHKIMVHPLEAASVIQQNLEGRLEGGRPLLVLGDHGSGKLNSMLAATCQLRDGKFYNISQMDDAELSQIIAGSNRYFIILDELDKASSDMITVLKRVLSNPNIRVVCLAINRQDIHPDLYKCFLTEISIEGGVVSGAIGAV